MSTLLDWLGMSYDHWWAVIVAMIAIVAVPIAVPIAIYFAINAYRFVSISVLGSDSSSLSVDPDRASSYVDTLDLSWIDDVRDGSVVVDEVEVLPHGGLPVARSVSSGSYASDRALRVFKEDDYA